MLKEKKKQLEQQLRSASRDKASFGHSPMPFDNKEENKIRELEKKLAQVDRGGFICQIFRGIYQ